MEPSEKNEICVRSGKIITGLPGGDNAIYSNPTGQAGTEDNVAALVNKKNLTKNQNDSLISQTLALFKSR